MTYSLVQKKPQQHNFNSKNIFMILMQNSIHLQKKFRSLKVFDNENRFYPNRFGRMHSSEWRDHQLSTIFAPNAFKVLC